VLTCLLWVSPHGCCCVTVRGIGKLKNLWAIVQKRTALKVLLRPVTKIMYNCVFLTNLNVHTCLYGSEVGQYFGAKPLKIDEYLRRL
jgi:hypothetical protein